MTPARLTVHPVSRIVAPAAILTVDAGEPAADIPLTQRDGRPFRSALVVVSDRGTPVGVGAIAAPGPVVSARRVQAVIEEVLAAASPAHGAPVAGPGPSASVVVTTCRDGAAALRAVRSILQGRHAPLEVIVVQNRPGDHACRARFEEGLTGDPRFRYVEEPRKGLSWARNAGLAAARGAVVAFTDDDVVADPGWVEAGVRGFARAPDVACVTGLILPQELETPGQVRFEQFAGFGKGFAPRTFRLADANGDRLYAYTPGRVGSGANTFVRTETLRSLGGFDPRLGAGTPAAGGEDLDLFSRLLRAGHAIAYEPAALIWHEHPAAEAPLHRHALDYGIGLGAAVAKQLIDGPDRRGLARAVPEGVRYALDPRSRKNAGRPPTFPRRLAWLERAGFALGPVAFAASAATTPVTRSWS